MHHVKKRPSNIFSGLVILIGVLVVIIGASNLWLLILGITCSIASAIALILSIKEGNAAEKEIECREQVIEQWMKNTQLRIDFESIVNAPAFEQEARWEAFDKVYLGFRSAWSLRPGETRVPIIGQAPIPKRSEE